MECVRFIRQSSRPERESPEEAKEEEQKEVKHPDVSYEDREIDTMGLLGLIFAIVGFVLLFITGFPFFMGTLAVIFGSLSSRNIDSSPDKYKYEWLANAALYMGIVLIIMFWALLILIILSAFASGW
jgi:flagellar biosynthesis protein FlhB